MHRELGLFSISSLEKGRISEQRPDPKDLALFTELEGLVSGSFVSTQSHAGRLENLSPEAALKSGTSLREPRVLTRAFRDETLLQKLMQFRERIPLSSRIIRTGQT
jgi:hypothetical protein